MCKLDKPLRSSRSFRKVTFTKDKGKYRSRVGGSDTPLTERLDIGYFAGEDEAARAHDMRKLVHVPQSDAP